MENKDYLISCLKDPMLLSRVVLDGLDEVIVGEEDARKTIFICSMGRLVKNANPTSYNLLVNSDSGAGKDHVVDNVLKVLPDEVVQKRTRISPTTLTYWHNSKFEPKWTWDGKVLYLEDCSNGIFNSDVFKVFTSGGSHATIVKDQVAIDIEIKGKPVVILTSASANPEPELVRRFIVVNLNEGETQTEEVMEKKLEQAVKGKVTKPSSDFQEALGLLHPRNVKIPWAKKLLKHLPKKNIIMRTHTSRFVDFIKASAVLHQYARQKDSEDYILADEQDYNIAKDILLATTCNDQFVPLTQSQQEVLTLLKELGKNIVGEGLCEREIGWSASELMVKLPFSKQQFYNSINKLVKNGFIEKALEKDDHSARPYAVFSYKEQTKVKLPKWEELQAEVSKASKVSP